MDVNTVRSCFALDLIDDPVLIAAYEHWHRPGGPPAAVSRSIRAAGIVAMDIWRVGPRLFMIMETGPDYDPQARAERDSVDPDIAAWETLMWTFQQGLPFAAPGEKWVAADRIYALDAQP